MSGFEFANKEFLWLLLLLPALGIFYFNSYKKRYPKLRISSAAGVVKYRSSLKAILYHSLFFLKIIALGLIIIALARPRYIDEDQVVETEGIDIVLSLDVSTSMLARDLDPDRITAAKEVAADFFRKRKTDRIGLVVFAGESFTQSPITIDHNVLLQLLRGMETGLLRDGTAIGSGLGVAVNRLKDSESKSKVIILLTDGVNNSGEADPRTAAALAEKFDIRIYTIGVGNKGKALAPVGTYPNGGYVYDYVDVEIDEELLKEVANKTGGLYYRATNNQELMQIYNEIDQLERSKVVVSTLPDYSEKYMSFAFAGGLLLLLFMFLNNTIFRSIT